MRHCIGGWSIGGSSFRSSAATSHFTSMCCRAWADVTQPTVENDGPLFEVEYAD
jgi:hypothetical protein